jgi:hypothetical protein
MSIMAALRKSARAVEARKKALEKAAEFEVRHQNLVKLSEEYFEAEGGIDDIEAELEEQIQALRDSAASRVTDLKERLKVTAQSMLATKEAKANVAQRLGLSSAVLGKLVAEKSSGTSVSSEPSTHQVHAQ